MIAVAGDNAALALKINSIQPPQTALLDIIFRSDIQLAWPLGEPFRFSGQKPPGF